MKKQKGKITKALSLLLVFLMLISAAPSTILDSLFGISVFAETSGIFEDKFTWTLDDEGTLTVSGSGETKDWDFNLDETPWSEYNEDIKKIVVEEGITYIGESIFRKCGAVTEISLPKGLVAIGRYAFEDCSNLKNVLIPDSVLYIGRNAFRGTALYDDASNIQDGVLYIGNFLIGAVEDISGSYSIKSGTTVIAEQAFCECDLLSEVVIPDSVSVIGRGTFLGCDVLKSVFMGNGVKEICKEAFSECVELTYAAIPNGVETIGEEAFRGCVKLSDISIPAGVTAIGYGAFNNTAYYNDESNWENGMLYIGSYFIDATENYIGECEIKEGSLTLPGYAFSQCYKLTKITVPGSVLTIGEKAFYDCGNLETVTLNEGIKKIGYGAFNNCSALSKITIPDSVETIEDNAFMNCRGMEEVIVGAGVKYIGEYALGYYFDVSVFKYKPVAGFKIYCHEGTAVEQYAKDNGFEYIIIGRETGIELQEDSTYSIADGYVSRIAPESSVESFKAQFNSSVTVKDANGNEVTCGNIGTGYIVSAGDEIITAIVSGDTDGNAKVDSTDYILVKRDILKIKGLDGAYSKAADTDGNGKIDSTDYILIKRHILGISKLG